MRIVRPYFDNNEFCTDIKKRILDSNGATAILEVKSIVPFTRFLCLLHVGVE